MNGSPDATASILYSETHTVQEVCESCTTAAAAAAANVLSNPAQQGSHST